MTKPQRWRISLREILLLTTVVALSIGMYVTAKKNVELSRSVADLRKDAAFLAVEDATKLNIVAIPNASPFEQTWRIQIPENSGYDYYLACSHTDIPASSSELPDPKSSPTSMTKVTDDLYGAEILLRLNLSTDSPKIYWSIEGWQGSAFEIAQTQAFWNVPMSETSIGGAGQTKSYPPGTPVELISIINRFDKNTNKWVNAKKYSGARVYLKPYKIPPNARR